MATASLPFHEWLKRRRKALDLSVDELSQRAACSPNTLRKLETGDRRPSRELAMRLGLHLQIAPEELPAFLSYARAGSADELPSQILPSVPPAAPAPAAQVAQVALGRPAPPRPLTRLIGREALVAEVSALLLGQEGRLVTLTGPGGVGKTRLALELAGELHGQFADGAVFVPLSALRDPASALVAVAEALHLPADGHPSPVVALREALRERHLLLVLDNLEQVLEIGLPLVELLAACPGLRVLSSSRAPLGVRGEQVVPVPPLDLPAEAQLADLEQLARTPAVALFVERVRAASPQFKLSGENGQAVAAICRRLDGLPLAIELAAARVRVLPPAQLLQRLDRRLPLLVGGTRDMPERHQTLRGAVAWSCQLLSPEERELFAQLAVFVGGGPLDAVASVCDGAGDPLARLDQLQALADHSLIQIAPDPDHPRFTMLAVIHEYAAELLAESGREREARRRHARWCHELCAQAIPMLNQVGQQTWIARLEAERDNLRAALTWLLVDDRPGAVEAAAELIWLLHRFWYFCGHLSEGLRWLELILARASELPEPLLADLLYAAGVLAVEHRQMARGEAWLLESLELARAIGRRARAAAALPLLSYIREQRGELSDAETLVAESVAIFREIGDQEGLGDALDRLAQCRYLAGDWAAAIELQEEVLAIRRRLGSLWLIGSALNNLGNTVHESGDPRRALPLIAEAAELFAQIGNMLVYARVRLNLGSVYLSLGDGAAAAGCYGPSLDLIWSLHDEFGLPWALRGIATVAIRSDPAAAARLFGKAEALARQHDWELPPFDRERLDAALGELRARLDPAVFEAAWRAGEVAELRQVVAQASALASALASP